MRQLLEKLAGDGNPQRGDRLRIMPFGANAATRAGGSLAATPGLIIQYVWRGLRGENGSARRQGTHKLQCIMLRDGGIRASSAPHSDLIPTPA